MTPLVDVVMVILIFLMLAGSFGTSEQFMASSVPIHAKGVGGVAPPPGWKPPVIVDVNVTANGDASILGVLNHELDPEKVKVALETKLAQLKAVPGNDPKNIEAILHPMPGTKWEALAPLYDAALRSNFSKVSFAQTQ
jgi:biopolymer transport protein ExbD